MSATKRYLEDLMEAIRTSERFDDLCQDARSWLDMDGSVIDTPAFMRWRRDMGPNPYTEFAHTAALLLAEQDRDDERPRPLAERQELYGVLVTADAIKTLGHPRDLVEMRFDLETARVVRFACELWLEEVLESESNSQTSLESVIAALDPFMAKAAEEASP